MIKCEGTESTEHILTVFVDGHRRAAATDHAGVVKAGLCTGCTLEVYRRYTAHTEAFGSL